MKNIIIYFLIILSIINCDYLINDKRIIDEINSNPKSSWKAGENKIFKGKTLSQVKKMFGAFILTNKKISTQSKKLKDLPISFDSRLQWKDCIKPLADQGACASGWAISEAGMLSDRFCISSNKTINVKLSSQDLLSCDHFSMGCNGGILDKNMDYLQEKGIVTEACWPYVSHTGYLPQCSLDFKQECPVTHENFKKYFGTHIEHFSNTEDAMNAILKNGPIISGFRLYRDFFNYKSGVYQHITGSYAGGHAIKIIGWGIDKASGFDYWVIANTWGSDWGMEGYFWMKKGTNECF
jgi:cathepsin B